MRNLTVIEGGLSKSGRPRRSVLPDLLEMKRGLHRPSKRVIRLRKFEVEVRREPFTSIDGEDHEGAVMRREIVCTIKLGVVEVGCAQFVEFQPPTCALNSDIWFGLDGHSMEDSVLAETLCEAWSWIGPDVSDYGNIVELRVVGCWVHTPHAFQIIEGLIEQLVPRHSIIVAQAHPLNPKDWRLTEAHDFELRTNRRRKALMRMCSRGLGFTPFPSREAANDGWMWRPRADLAGVIQPPSPSPIRPGTWLE